jgi:hypothetical protein
MSGDNFNYVKRRNNNRRDEENTNRNERQFNSNRRPSFQDNQSRSFQDNQSRTNFNTERRPSFQDNQSRSFQDNQSRTNFNTERSYMTQNYNRVVVRSSQTRRKSSRTLLLKEVGDREFTYEGLQQVEKSPQGNLFLVFDTLDNSRKAFKDLRINKINCKYSYYKLFFKSTNLDSVRSYDDLKTSFLALLTENVKDVNILYFKYYRKDGKFTGSGDFVVDRKVDCDELVKTRTLKMGESEFTYYRYRTNRNLLTHQKSGSATDSNNSEEETQ